MWNNIIEWLQVNPWFGAFDKFFEEHEAIRFMYTRWFLGVVLIFIVEIVLIAIGVHRINKKKKIAYALLEAEEKRNIEKENEVVSFEDQVLDFNTDIDFYAEALKRKDEFLGDLEGLLRINSELTEFNKDSETPFGKGINDALKYMNKLAEDEGFKVENFDNYASHVEYGKQKNFIGGIGHLDVVPAGINWDNPPYGAVTVDGKLYARGAEDDKGPTMAFFYAMKILKEMDLKLSKRIKLVLSTDEESGWRDMDYYMAKNPETPFAAFIPDANFPVIYAEKGIANIRLCAKNEIPFVKSIYGGNRSNMVPDKATVTFAHEVPLSSAYIEKTLNKFLKDNSLVGAYDKEKDTVTIEGVSAHGSTPEKGINAVTKLFEFLSTFYIKNSTIDVINNYFLNDCLGKKIGYDYHDNEMGDLTSNLGVIKYENNEVSLELNIRYPKGTTAEGICDTINNVLGSSGFKASIVLDNKLKYVDPNGKLIKLLVGVYRKYSNDLESQPIVTGGGTFARLWENSVAFGPNFPGKESNIHNKNECIEIEDLIKTIAIYAESLYLLAK